MLYYLNSEYTTTRKLIYLTCAFSVGANGAPTLITKNGMSNGVASIVRTNSARYSLSLGRMVNGERTNLDTFANSTMSASCTVELPPEATTNSRPSGRCTPSTTPAPDPDPIPNERTVTLAFESLVGASGPTFSYQFLDLPEGTIVRVLITIRQGG